MSRLGKIVIATILGFWFGYRLGNPLTMAVFCGVNYWLFSSNSLNEWWNTPLWGKGSKSKKSA